jgi:hypothetical protein
MFKTQLHAHSLQACIFFHSTVAIMSMVAFLDVRLRMVSSNHRYAALQSKTHFAKSECFW